MSNIHNESLKLMDDFLESISDDRFLEDYLLVEESQGILVKDFLMSPPFAKRGYTVMGSSLNITISISELPVHRLERTDFSTSHAANDNHLNVAA